MRFPLIIITCMLLSCAFVGHAQQMTPTEEEAVKLERMKQMLYTMTAPLFQAVPEGLLEAKPQNGVPWESERDQVDLETILPLIEKEHEFEYKTSFGKQKIQVRTKLPNGITLNRDWLKCQLLDAKITDSNNKPVTLNDRVEIQFLTNSNSKMIDGQMVTENYTTFMLVCEIQAGENLSPPYKGNFDIELTYANKFEVVQFSAKEKGQTINFGGEKITIHDVNNNLAVFSTQSTGARKYSIENVNDEGHVLGINFEKAQEMYPDYMPFSSTASMDQAVYDIFTANPEISEADFGNAIHNHLLNKLRNPTTKDQKITVSKQLGPIDNLVFYQQLEPQKHLLRFEL